MQARNPWRAVAAQVDGWRERPDPSAGSPTVDLDFRLPMFEARFSTSGSRPPVLDLRFSTSDSTLARDSRDPSRREIRG